MIRTSVFTVVAIFMLAGSTLAQRREKPVVQVIFEFLENGYRKQLATEASTVEQVARERLLRDLNGQLPFLRFTADSQDIILRVRLGSPNASSEMHAVNFRISVEGRDSLTNKPLHSPIVSWAYRSATAYDSPLGSAAALGTDIGLRFQQGDHDQLVEKALRVVALSHDGMLVQSSPIPVWVIPFTQDDLCMDFPSYLEIEDEYHTDTGDRSDHFRVKANGLYSSADPASPIVLQRKIEGIPGDPPPDQSQSLQDLKSSTKEQNKVVGVHVLRYNRRSPSCSDVVQPPNFAPTGGSQ